MTKCNKMQALRKVKKLQKIISNKFNESISSLNKDKLTIGTYKTTD